jgi:hypothetical protein
MLSSIDAALALMFSPHPSHLPLELATAGVPTVTNTFLKYRKPWVKGLRLASPHPQDIAAHLTLAAEAAGNLAEHRFEPLAVDLGNTLESALGVALEELS